MTSATATRGKGGLFWAILAVVLLGLGAFAWHLEQSRGMVRLDVNGAPYIAESKRAAYLEALDGFHRIVDGALTGEARGDIEAVVDRQIDAAFAPVYANLPGYLDFHYSVMGEYTEIGAALGGDFTRAMRERLLDEAALRQALAGADTAISAEFNRATAEALETIRGAAQTELSLSQVDLSLLGDAGVVALTLDDAIERFDTPLTAARGVGAVVGGALVVRSVRAVSKRLVARIARRAAVRAGGKAAGIGGGAGTGAAMGSVLGPIGAAAGGLIGGVVGWVATDAVLIELDEVINRDAFSAELTAMIDGQKQGIKAEIIAGYGDDLARIAADQKADYRAPAEVVFGTAD